MIAQTVSRTRALVAVGVHRLVDLRREPVEPDEGEQRLSQTQQRTSALREEQEAEEGRRDDEDRLDPEVGADVVVADREQEADRGEHQRRGAADRPLERTEAAAVSPWPGCRRAVSKMRTASPPIEVGSTWPAA